MNKTSYEEFDLVLEEIIQSYKLAAKKIYLGAQEGRKLADSDIEELTRANCQVTFVRHLKMLRQLRRNPLMEGLQTIKELYEKQNDEHGRANIAVCERLLMTFTPCDVRSNIHVGV